MCDFISVRGRQHNEAKTERQLLDGILRKELPTVEKGLRQKLTAEDTTRVLTTMLFEITNQMGQKLVQVKDYDEMKKSGPFRYAGQISTMHAEGLIPEDVYMGLKEAGRENHIGPVYLKVKGLLTWLRARELFGQQMALTVREHLAQDPLSEPSGSIVVIPNMTGGAWIGDETLRRLEVLELGRVWPVTPYARDMRIGLRKVIDDSAGAQYGQHVEGLMPSPANTAAIVCFEELRTAAETTKNATDIHRNLGGYNQGNNVRIIEAAVFDYLHPVGIERLKRLGVTGLYLVDGEGFLKASRDLGYVTKSQFDTAMEWLSDPWGFTREMMPTLREIARR